MALDAQRIRDALDADPLDVDDVVTKRVVGLEWELGVGEYLR